jgi:hypothetical protein
LNSENPARLDNLPTAAAVLAGLWLGASFCTSSGALDAGLMTLDLNRLSNTPGCFKQVERDFARNVAPLAWPPTSAASPISEQIAEQTSAENISKCFEDVVDIAELMNSALNPGVTESIVARSFVVIAKHLERLGCLFEMFSGIRVPGIPVGMKFQRKLAVSVGNLFLAGAFADA